MRTLAALLLFALLTPAARAAEPWLKPNDVVALVGGEDMVALAEEGWLETLITWAQPGDRIRFRSLAWEGDTVFEQRRDLNYPALETQLDRMGATVVLCQFGKMESFAGMEGIAAFTEAYEKLIARLGGEKKRRIALVQHTPFSPPPGGAAPYGFLYAPLNEAFSTYDTATVKLCIKHDFPFLYYDTAFGRYVDHTHSGRYFTRDGVHLKADMQLPLALDYAVFLGIAEPPRSRALRIVAPGESPPERPAPWHPAPGTRELPPAADIPKLLAPLRAAIQAKNRLWFHYTRPQNWAFLAGNRTNQPSSRDHLDPTKRWFPEEMEQWLPLIEAKEKEIWALAAAPR